MLRVCDIYAVDIILIPPPLKYLRFFVKNSILIYNSYFALLWWIQPLVPWRSLLVGLSEPISLVFWIQRNSKFIIGCYYLVKHSILGYRQFFSGHFSLGSLFPRIILIGIYPSFIKGLICCYLVEHSILVYRRYVSGCFNFGSFFFRVFSLIGILTKFIKGFGLLLFGKVKHIGLSAIFDWIF